MLLSAVIPPATALTSHKGSSKVGIGIVSVLFFRIPVSTALPKFNWIELKYERENSLINFLSFKKWHSEQSFIYSLCLKAVHDLKK